jgi:hypothetical protein
MTTPQGTPNNPWYKKVWIWAIIIVGVAGISVVSNLIFQS